MAGETRNLGQVSGVFIGTTPPENTTLIWFDSTPSQRCHKIYDPALNQWVILNQGIISAITYSELTSIAQGVGLSVGKFFKITDKGNALALAITSTKVQYDDSLGNILIDDLGTNIQYHVTSSNLLIDDVAGVFDTTNKKLVFQFNEITTPDFSNDYILGKAKRNNIWSLVKYKFSTLLSTVTGNSLSWNNGLFFNFNSAFNAKLDQSGGAVAKDTYDQDIELLQQDIENVASGNQQIMENANAAIAAATADAQIYAKRMQAPQTTGEAIDLAAGDSLWNGLSKIQRFINRFKFATGIRVSLDFTDNVPDSYVNNNDTVDSALRKLQHQVKAAAASSVLSSSWEPLPYDEDIPDVAPGDTLDEAFAKAIGKLNQIGDISNGKIESKERTVRAGETSVPVTVLDLENGGLKFNQNWNFNEDDEQAGISLNRENGISISKNTAIFSFSPENGFRTQTDTPKNYRNLPGYEMSAKVSAGSFLKSYSSSPYGDGVGMVAALSAEADTSQVSSGIEKIDAYFRTLKTGELSLGYRLISDDDFDANNAYRINEFLGCSYFRCNNGTGTDATIYLPANPKNGEVLFFHRGSGKFVINANGNMFTNLRSSLQLNNDSGAVLGSTLMLVAQRTESSIYAIWYPNLLTNF